MAKITIPSTSSGYNLSVINEALQSLATELNTKVLYRANPSGEPNSMGNNLDMNGYQILNLPAPATVNSPARLQDVQAAITGILPASLIPFTPTATIGAVTVQSAIEEADTENRAASASIVSNLIASTGSTLVSWIHSATGAVARTIANIFLDEMRVTWFLSSAQLADVRAGTLTLDCTAAMQAAHNTGKVVKYPAGKYKFSKLTGITAGGIVGDGQTQTILVSTDTTTDDLIGFTGASVGGPANANMFKDFQIFVEPLQKTAGAAIAIKPSSGENTYASFFNVTTSYVPTGLDFVAASLYSVKSCNFLAYSVAGVKVANTHSTDAGDSTISDCVFSTPYTTGAGVLQKSSGGLRVINNKFLGGAYGYLLSYYIPSGSGIAYAPTSNLLFVGNSIELYTGAGVFFEQTATASFVNVSIANNEFGVMQGANTVGIASDANPAWLSDMTITGNVFNMMTVGQIYSIGLSNVSNVCIEGNTFKFNGGTTPRAVVLDTCTNVKIGTNVYAGLTNSPFSITGGSKIFITKEMQTGTVTVPSAGSSAYGSLNVFPVASVTFTVPYLGILTSKDIEVSIGATSGEVAASIGSITTSGDTTTGFTVNAVSVNTNAATVNWKAFGTI